MKNFHNNTLTINLSTITDNYKTISHLVKKHAKIAAVVKADAYGLGALEITKHLFNIGCNEFYVASIEEGIALRRNIIDKYSIFVLNGPTVQDHEAYVEYDIIPVINNLHQMNIWHNYSVKINKPLNAILHINTGINRLGMIDEELHQIIYKHLQFPNIKWLYIMSHLAIAQDHQSHYNEIQLNYFRQYIKYFPNIKSSLANSSGVFLGQEYHFDMVRAGCAIYGINPTINSTNPMQNPIVLTSKVIHIHKVNCNSYVGYNLSFQTKSDSILATIPIGYADGYSRALSNSGFVYINQYKAPIVGIVSMDLTIIDVSHIPTNEVYIGQTVEIINNLNDVNNIAAQTNTIAYEILTNLKNARLNKVYIS